MSRRKMHDYFDDDFIARLQGLRLIAKRLSGLSGPPGPFCPAVRGLGDGLEFADHRAYSPGDDVRFLDWAYYARMEKLLLRLFHEHSEQDVAILLDVSASMACGPGGMEKFHYARRAAAALAYVATGSGRRVLIQPFAHALGEPMRSGRDRRKILNVLEFLGRLRPEGRTDLRRCAQRFGAMHNDVATVLLISDMLDCTDVFSGSLGALVGRGRRVVVLHVFSPADASPPAGGALRLRHAETGREMDIDVTAPLRRSYRQRWETMRKQMQSLCRARKAVYVAARTDLPLERLILRTLPGAGVLR